MPGPPYHDETAYDVPVKDTTPSKYGAGALLQYGALGNIDEEDAYGDNKQGQQRRAISKLGRDELEDKYLRLYEENLVLKKHARKQEDKIKRMATKLLRLVNDKKKIQHLEGGGRVRDVETEEMMEDLHGKIRELEKQNEQLKNKLMVSKQQIATQNKRTDPYTYVQSRVDTGRGPKPPASERIKRGLRVQGEGAKSATPRAFRNDVLPRYGHSLLEEARAENRQLEEYIQQLQDQVAILEHDSDMAKERISRNDRELEAELLRLREQMSAGQRSNIQENVELIKLQREIKEKSTKLSAMQAQYQNLEDNLRTVKSSHEGVLREMDKLNNQLQAEQNKVMNLQSELKSGTITQRQLIELQERISDSDREKEILKEANEKLLSSAFDADRERQYRANEKQLKLQIAQLEATLKGDLNDKNTILDKLTDERETREKLDKDNRELQIKYYSSKQELDELSEKMKFFTKESAVDFQELEEALILVKKRKEAGSQNLEFLERVDDELNKDMKQQIVGLQAEHAETVEELEKTRNMLILQHKINRDYQQEVESSTARLEDYKKEYDTKLEEYAQLLDIRAARIKKLESQLKDIAYGTKQVKLKDFVEHDDEYEEIDETLKLERGQNVFEIHIQKISYSREALNEMGDSEPSTFVTYEFFEFEVQSTPVVKGNKPDFDFTSQYVVTVDDFFLHHLMKESTTLEVHQGLGTEYHTVAACQLKFRDLLEKPQGRLHGTAQLTGMDRNHVGTNYGVIEYWVRLRVPMDQALRLFRERLKALGYMTSNYRATEEAIQALDTREATTSSRDKNLNELVVKIIRANNVNARRNGVQPSSYCIYRFFDFKDHDTVIIPNSNKPEFNDSKLFPVPMNVDLDRYLRTEHITVYVFDDTDPEEQSYLGLAKIPLISLAHGKGIKGTFELKTADGKGNGTLDVHMKWQYTYVPPKQTSVAKAVTKSTLKDSQPVPSSVTAAAPIETPIKQSAVPIAASTPTKSSVPTAKPRIRTSEHQQAKTETSEKTKTKAEASQRTKPKAEVTDQLGTKTRKEITFEDKTKMEPARDFTLRQIEPESTMHVATPIMESDNSVTSDVVRETDSDDDTMTENNSKVANGEGEGIEDTMFEENYSDDDDQVTDPSLEKETDIPNGMEDGDGNDTSDDIKTDDELESQDDSSVVMTPAINRPASSTGNDNVVTVAVFSLMLDEESDVMQDDKIQRLYVEYRFLGVDPAELETPFSLPKPKPNQRISYNFKKNFHVDIDNNKLRRDYLASMLLPEDVSEGKIRFTIVNEPPEDHQSLDCEDIGYAYVDVCQILQKGRDVIEQDLDIYDAMDEEETIIGTLNVTVECLAALQAVKKELPPSAS
ncbi:protein fantom-like [Saccoglossus kowalevskii]